MRLMCLVFLRNTFNTLKKPSTSVPLFKDKSKRKHGIVIIAESRLSSNRSHIRRENFFKLLDVRWEKGTVAKGSV